jgi:hypothetical protein
MLGSFDLWGRPYGVGHLIYGCAPSGPTFGSEHLSPVSLQDLLLQRTQYNLIFFNIFKSRRRSPSTLAVHYENPWDICRLVRKISWCRKTHVTHVTQPKPEDIKD